MDKLTSNVVDLNGQKTFYYSAGPSDGQLLIFIHGWPDLAETWKHQLFHFSSLGYRVVAPDMRGYGKSSGPKVKEAYALSVLVPELISLLHHLGASRAIWVSHDWGSGVTNSLAAHYPEACLGIVNLSVAYRTVELGLAHELTLTNRAIYPEETYPNGQWDYQVFYEQSPDLAARQLETAVEKTAKLFYIPPDPASWGKPSSTATTVADGGLFKGNPDAMPDVPLSATMLDESLYSALVQSHRTHGGFGPTAYYLNHAENEIYAKEEKNGGVLEFPFLYIDAKYDAVCSTTTTPKMGEVQREFVKDLTVVTVESGHWSMLQTPREVNEAIEKWLREKFGKGKL
ncbi:hypothetical protein CAC42_6831 [Sphaceloma murrayae]|uniref:AB hydrolase-1 domain-containing protein n=1 Tax=Sphaceloma murrayae TaxID=2082308 RepID=A0A2K1QGK8_9PEZI|nr:hypothetical protein CAC42_6831 [Sphaceloma murrayae]